MRWPVSRVLSRSRGDGHPSGTPVARRLLRPTRRRGDAPLCGFRRHVPSYLALHQVELARFTRPAEAEPTRLCGAGPRLAADGCYPLPCVVVLGLSSGDGSPRHTRPSGHLTGCRTLPPAGFGGWCRIGRAIPFGVAGDSTPWTNEARLRTRWESEGRPRRTWAGRGSQGGVGPGAGDRLRRVEVVIGRVDDAPVDLLHVLVESGFLGGCAQRGRSQRAGHERQR